jgi:hypothetical protein
MLKIDDEKLCYDLKLIEHLGALARNPKAQISNLISAKKAHNPWTREVLKGVRAPGTGFPFLIMLGTMWHRRGRDFCVVYKRNSVLILEFRDEKFNRWIIPDSDNNRSTLSRVISMVDLPVLAQ